MENELTKKIKANIQELAPLINAGFAARDQQKQWPGEYADRLGAIGVHGAFLPAGEGGQGLGYREYADVLQELGYRITDNGLNFSVMAHSLACLWPLYIHARSSQIRGLLQHFASGKYMLTNAITEAQGGSDVYNMQTTALPVNGGYKINGFKSFCTNAPIASHALVYARTDMNKGFMGGISAFLVPLDTKGVEVGKNFDKMGLRTAQASTISFKDVILPAEWMVGTAGTGGMIFQESMVFEKIFMAAAHTGTLQRWLEHMQQFAKERLVNNEPVIRQQAVAHTLADVKILMESCKAIVDKALAQMDSRNLSAKISFAAIVKYVVSTSMNTAAQKYMGLFAGEGFKTDRGIEVQVRDFMGAAIYSGTAEIQKNIIASTL